jgi:hypothetical protein
MRYVSRHQGKSELKNRTAEPAAQNAQVRDVRDQRRVALLTRCEARGREVYTAGGQYLGLAETPERAAAWAEVGELLKLCKRGADGQPPSQEEFAAAVGRLLKAG